MTQGRTTHEVEANYLDNLQRLVSCVTPSVVTAELHQPFPVPHSATINDGDPVLMSGASRLQLAFRQSFIIEESEQDSSWRVVVGSYSYEVHDADGSEVLLYHWHPRGNSPVVIPHLHLEQGTGVIREVVRDAHLPTGEVSLNAVLRVLIEEMGVNPRRPDWDSILA